MHRIDHATATVDNLFTEGDPVGGIAATVMTDDWANAVQEEICEVVETAGLTLNKADNTQLLDALVAMGVRAASTTETGVVELATNAETLAGTDTTRVVTPAGLASFTKSLASNGYIKLPGGLILQWGSGVTSSGGTLAVTFPLAFPTACLQVFTTDQGIISTLHIVGSDTGTTTGFNAYSVNAADAAAASNFKWLAIGY